MHIGLYTGCVHAHPITKLMTIEAAAYECYNRRQDIFANRENSVPVCIKLIYSQPANEIAWYDLNLGQLSSLNDAYSRWAFKSQQKSTGLQIIMINSIWSGITANNNYLIHWNIKWLRLNLIIKMLQRVLTFAAIVSGFMRYMLE